MERGGVNLIIRKASVRWTAGAESGSAARTSESQNQKSSKSPPRRRLKGRAPQDPTELIAAAHAGSFSLALSEELGLKARATGETITTATVTAEHLAAGWTIRNIHLNVVAKLPKMTQARFIDAALRAKINCLVSRLLRANISMNAKLERNSEPRQRRPIVP